MIFGAMPPEVVGGIVLAILGLPANLALMIATYRKAKSTDQAVNHRASGTTISEDIADIRAEQRSMRKEMLWMNEALFTHLRKRGEQP